MNTGSLPILVVGAGPAGLMAAEQLSTAGWSVQVVDHKPSAARKFLMAGKGGLNISHSEDFAQFVQRYDAVDWLKPMLHAFGPQQIQDWMQRLGVSSYVGSSGRIFPDEMKAAPLLRAWIAQLKTQGVRFDYRTRWLGWSETGEQRLQTEGQAVIEQAYAATVLAVGGGSWARLGSDGQSLSWLAQQSIAMTPLQAANGGVQVAWSPFVQALAGQPLKRVAAWVNDNQVVQAEAVITPYGLEGGLIYALSRPIRQQLAQHGTATLWLDLLPDLEVSTLAQRLTGQGKQSLANIWRKAGLDTAKATLIREVLPKSQWADVVQVAQQAKALPIQITGLQPIDEAISTAGGIAQTALDQRLMLRDQVGVFCCGEMLDWDAPTGGYLLTACLASGRWAGQGVLDWLVEQG
jgi:uncharacterized flavoprotein (TIGR03862 family)